VPTDERVTRLPGGRPVSISIACVGLATTCIAIVLAAFPAPDEPDKPLALIKIVGMTAVMLGTGWFVHWWGSRRASAALPDLVAKPS